MAPRVDSPTSSFASFQSERDEESQTAPSSFSLQSRPLRRVPTPMRPSHPSSSASAFFFPQVEHPPSLFDQAECATSHTAFSAAASRQSFPDQGTATTAAAGQRAHGATALTLEFSENSEGPCEFDELSSVKHRANQSLVQGRVPSMRALVYGNTCDSHHCGSVQNASSSPSKPFSVLDTLTETLVSCSQSLPQDIHKAVGNLLAGTTESVDGLPHAASEESLSRFASYFEDEEEEFDEAKQIQRLGSWNTLETSVTAVTEGTNDADTAVSVGRDSGLSQHTTVYDDDGNPIPGVLLDLTKERRSKRTTAKKMPARRKRIVQFDYPPISSLRECPRPDPRDLPHLFFTEDELNQIEDDRASTHVADDVEVVAVSSTESSSSSSKHPKAKRQSSEARQKVNEDERDSAALLAQPAKDTASPRRLGRRRSRHLRSAVSQATPPTSAAHNDNNPLPATAETMERMVSPKPRRLIRSVHIYMRERSRECRQTSR
jgi:hypothetical protein